MSFSYFAEDWTEPVVEVSVNVMASVVNGRRAAVEESAKELSSMED